jgi:hypothetical protein
VAVYESAILSLTADTARIPASTAPFDPTAARLHENVHLRLKPTRTIKAPNSNAYDTRRALSVLASGQ